MSKLSPDARDLIDAARAGEGAPAQARDRVRARVLARVGAGAAVGSAAMLGSTSTAAAKTGITAALLVKLAAGVGVASVVAVIAAKTGLVSSWGRGSPQLAVTAAVSPTQAQAAAPIVEKEPPRAAAAPPAPAVPSAAPAETSKPAAPSAPPRARPTAAPVPSSLEAETAMLEKAQAELRAGHPERALAALDDHDARLDNGVLGEERRAERILALCAAGRAAEAKAEADRFLAESPRSPMAARVRSSCAGSAK